MGQGQKDGDVVSFIPKGFVEKLLIVIRLKLDCCIDRIYKVILIFDVLLGIRVEGLKRLISS